MKRRRINKPPKPALTKNQRAVLRAIRELRGSPTVEAIARKTGLSLKSVRISLSALEVKKRVKSASYHHDPNQETWRARGEL